MGKPYSQDLRERVIAAVDTGTGAYVAALLFQVSVSYICKALNRVVRARCASILPCAISFRISR
jgi:transposase